MVSRIEKRVVNTEVVLDIGIDTSFVAMITNESQNFFSVRSPVCALVKASHVILAVEE